MQILINGMVNGLIIGLLALSFSVAYLPTRVFHLGLAGVYVAAPYIALTLLNMGVGWPVTIAITILASGAISGLCELINHRSLERRNASETVHLVSALGTYILLSQGIALFFGNTPQTLRSGVDRLFTGYGLTLTDSQMIKVATSVVFLVFSFILLLTTKFGLQLRAIAQNPREIMLLGFNVWQLRLRSFFLGGILCGAASLASAYDYGFDPNSGLSTLLLATVAVMIGGQNSFWAPFFGGLTLGLLRSEATWWLSARWQDAVTFGFLALILIFRPVGLLGKKRRIEEQ